MLLRSNRFSNIRQLGDNVIVYTETIDDNNIIGGLVQKVMPKSTLV